MDVPVSTTHHRTMCMNLSVASADAAEPEMLKTHPALKTEIIWVQRCSEKPANMAAVRSEALSGFNTCICHSLWTGWWNWIFMFSLLLHTEKLRKMKLVSQIKVQERGRHVSFSFHEILIKKQKINSNNKHRSAFLQVCDWPQALSVFTAYVVAHL